jgi:hypothetical protein
VDTKLEDLEEKICEKFAGKFKTKVRDETCFIKKSLFLSNVFYRSVII